MSALSEIVVGPTELADLFAVTPRMISHLVDAGTIARLPGKGSKFNVRDVTRKLCPPFAQGRGRTRARPLGQGGQPRRKHPA